MDGKLMLTESDPLIGLATLAKIIHDQGIGESYSQVFNFLYEGGAADILQDNLEYLGATYGPYQPYYDKLYSELNPQYGPKEQNLFGGDSLSPYLNQLYGDPNAANRINSDKEGERFGHAFNVALAAFVLAKTPKAIQLMRNKLDNIISKSVKIEDILAEMKPGYIGERPDYTKIANEKGLDLSRIPGYTTNNLPDGSDLPYNSRDIRKALEERYGAENVTSTTVPPDNKPNVKLAGKVHPVTGVRFDLKGYPIFDDIAYFDTKLPNSSNLSYTDQMKAATNDLWKSIQRGEIPANKFTPEQLKQIEAGADKITDLTWHHHQDKGRMQLIDTSEHQKTGHIGSIINKGR